ncbi:MAG TPA: DUF4440 domain-containing protein [Bacteroidales bacterium]|nr:DUF4440 domain-containing protein [Bacteroidales bacterium]
MHLSLANEPDLSTVTEKIKNILFAQADAWNKGDLSGYMNTYWKSDSLRFIGKNGIQYGWKTTFENYQKSYPDKATMGTLTFDILSAEMLCISHVFVIGKWNITREKGSIGGYFTLIFEKKEGKWVITFDHSS